jgi:biopolymer transport protein ExbD
MINRRHTLRGILPLTSMADIAFILLIFFILTSTIDMDRSIPVNLPETETSAGGSYKFFHVWINSSGDIYLRGEKKSEDDLIELARYRAIDNPDIKGLIGAEKGISFSKVNRVMELLRDSGVYNIVLLTKKHNE